MALATYTCSVFDNTAKFHHIGDITVTGQVAWTATSTVGDIAFLAKIPHGAKIVDFMEYHTTGASTQALSFGFDRGIAAGGGGNLSVLGGSLAQATSNRLSLGILPTVPLIISCSDTDTQRYAILEAKVESGTTTTSLIVSFSFTYRFDGPDVR